MPSLSDQLVAMSWRAPEIRRPPWKVTIASVTHLTVCKIPGNNWATYSGLPGGLRSFGRIWYIGGNFCRNIKWNLPFLSVLASLPPSKKIATPPKEICGVSFEIGYPFKRYSGGSPLKMSYSPKNPFGFLGEGE